MKHLLLLGLTCLVVACGPSIHPDNEIPFGALDLPAPGAVVPPGPLLVGGWALDDEGIDRVRVFLDRRLVGEARLAVARPDVVRLFPQHSRGTAEHGWNTIISLPNTPGSHEILAQAVDVQGATRDLGTVAIIIGS
jgi:hypothetical protein